MLTESSLSVLADVFRLMGDPTRLKVLLACLDETLPVAELARRAGASPSLVSHHLRLLRAARMVRAERRGQQVFYTAADAHVRTVLRDMAAHVAEPEPSAVASGRKGASRASKRGRAA